MFEWRMKIKADRWSLSGIWQKLENNFLFTELGMAKGIGACLIQDNIGNAVWTWQ